MRGQARPCPYGGKAESGFPDHSRGIDSDTVADKSAPDSGASADGRPCADLDTRTDDSIRANASIWANRSAGADNDTWLERG